MPAPSSDDDRTGIWTPEARERLARIDRGEGFTRSDRKRLQVLLEPLDVLPATRGFAHYWWVPVTVAIALGVGAWRLFHLRWWWAVAVTLGAWALGALVFDLLSGAVASERRRKHYGPEFRRAIDRAAVWTMAYHDWIKTSWSAHASKIVASKALGEKAEKGARFTHQFDPKEVKKAFGALRHEVGRGIDAYLAAIGDDRPTLMAWAEQVLVIEADVLVDPFQDRWAEFLRWKAERVEAACKPKNVLISRGAIREVEKRVARFSL